MKKENKTKFIKIESSYDYLTETMQTMEEGGYTIVSFAPSLKGTESYVVVGKLVSEKKPMLMEVKPQFVQNQIN